MTRPRLAPGEHGEIWVKQSDVGKFVARVQVRGLDGRIRDVTASAATRGGARRELERRLKDRARSYADGMSPSMTLADAGTFWLEHRQRSGRAAGRGSVKPQTLAAYADAHHRLVVKMLGGLRLSELSVGLLDNALQELEATGISTAQARSVLNQTLGLAVRHGAIEANPMTWVSPSARDVREVDALSVAQVHVLRHLVSPAVCRTPAKRGPNRDLADVVDLCLGTGARIGEVLALEWQHVDLDADIPTARICGTLVEPRAGFVDALHRQETTKSKSIRTLILPEHVVRMLRERREGSARTEADAPVLSSGNGTWLWPNNVRTRLRAAVKEHDDLGGTSPHTLRRTVGTLVAHERGLDAAREQLGHSDSSVTYRSYVAAQPLGPDLRDLLDRLFERHED